MPNPRMDPRVLQRMREKQMQQLRQQTGRMVRQNKSSLKDYARKVVSGVRSAKDTLSLLYEMASNLTHYDPRNLM